MKSAVRLVLCWVAFVAALFLSGMIVKVLQLHAVVGPGHGSLRSMMLAQLGAGAVLVIGLWPLARSLAAPAAARAAAFIGFLFFALGVNSLIEAKKFTSVLDAGWGSAAVFYACMAVVLGAAVGLFFGEAGQAAGFAHRNWADWAWRVAAAWLGWPVVYFFFGMCVAPIVVPYYTAGVAGLRIPSTETIFEVQLIRSVIFLATSVSFVALWKGSRRSLWLALGWAHACTIGLYGIVGAGFLPMVLRVTHGIEMTCDAFAYAGLLVLLFAAPGAKTSVVEANGTLAPLRG